MLFVSRFSAQYTSSIDLLCLFCGENFECAFCAHRFRFVRGDSDFYEIMISPSVILSTVAGENRKGTQVSPPQGCIEYNTFFVHQLTTGGR